MYYITKTDLEFTEIIQAAQTECVGFFPQFYAQCFVLFSLPALPGLEATDYFWNWLTFYSDSSERYISV